MLKSRPLVPKTSALPLSYFQKIVGLPPNWGVMITSTVFVPVARFSQQLSFATMTQYLLRQTQTIVLLAEEQPSVVRSRSVVIRVFHTVRYSVLSIWALRD